MRNLTAALAALSIFVSAGVAQADGALAPGKPAGLSRAQGRDDNTILYILGIGAIAAGIAIVASSNSDNGTPAGGGGGGGGSSTTSST